MAAIPGGVRVGGFIAPTDSTDIYAVTDPKYGRGSLRSVADITERNAITLDRRFGQLGMEVVTIDTMNKYRLITEPGTAGTTDVDWQLITNVDLWSDDGLNLSPIESRNTAIPINKNYGFTQPTNATFYATFSKSVDADYALGGVAGTAVGGASIVDEWLDLAHSDARYVTYSAPLSADFTQLGAVKFKVRPNYSGTPSDYRNFFSVSAGIGSLINIINLYQHPTGGVLKLSVYNSGGTSIYISTFAAWVPVAGTTYELELNVDITTGATRLFIDGVQFGVTLTGTGIRSNNINVLCVGSAVNDLTQASNHSFKDYIIYNAVQHTANYTPGYTLQNIQLATSNSAVNNLQVFGATNLSALNTVNGVLRTDSNGLLSSSLLSGTDIVNNSSVVGATVTDSLNTLNNQIGISAVTFYLDDTAIIPIGTQNNYAVNTLTKIPVTTTEVIDTIVVNKNTVLKEVYLYDTPITGTQIEAGQWEIDLWRSVDFTVFTTQILINMMLAVAQSGTITITGTGINRTATSSAASVFIAGDANADLTTASYVQTPTGFFQITGFTSDQIVTIVVPSTYVNEATVAFSKHKRLFQVTTGDINDTSLTFQSIISVQSAFPIASEDKLSTIYFGRTPTTSNITISYTHNGNARYTHFKTPLALRHDVLAGVYSASSTEPYGHIPNGAIPNGTTATTQLPGDNTTKLATNAFVQEALGTASDVFASHSLYVKQFGSDKAEIYYPAGTTGTGFINIAADFPAGWGGVTQGDCYTIPNGVTVTDNDITKTNTGQTFVGPMQIAADVTNTRWLERDGLTLQTCVSSVATALYLSQIYSSNTYPIFVLDSSIYTFGDGAAFFPNIFAPIAKFVHQGIVTIYSSYLDIGVIEINSAAGSGGYYIGVTAKAKINVKYAYFNGTAPTAGLFLHAGSGDMAISAGNIDGGTSATKVLACQSTGRLFVTVDKMRGLAQITSGSSTITINTVDRTDITKKESTGRIVIVSNLEDISAIKQTIGQISKPNCSDYFDSTVITAAGSENANQILTLTSYPDSSVETDASIVATNAAPTLFAFYKYDALLNKIAVAGGVWTDKSWYNVSNNSYTTTVIKRICIVTGDGVNDVVTTSGTGTTRTATITSSFITFSASDADADPLIASYLQTPSGFYQIITYNAANSVDIATPTGYTNEVGVAFQRCHNVFAITSPNIDNLSVQEITSFSASQTGYTLTQTATVGVIVFVTTTSPTSLTVHFYYNGSTRYSHIETPEFAASKSFMTFADTSVGSGTRAHYLLTDSSTYAFNFYIPQDALEVDGMYLLFNPASSGAGNNVDLTTNYTVAINGSITEYSASDTATTYTFTAGYVNRIPLKTLILSAQYGANGSLVVTNSSGIDMEVYGIETFYR